ncbi:MAG: sigma-70 family RNA polymerase sigma factor [Acidimicrobiia bacterium]
MRDDSDALAARAAGGDRRALETLLDRHADRIHAVCRRVLADREDALDATQEAMIAIARGIARFDGRSAFTTWMYRVATNAALDEARRKQRRPRPVDDVADTPGRTSPSSSSGASSGDGEFDAVVADRLDIDNALRTLPDDFRVAVVLRDLCDLDYAEIADVLQIPPGTVRSRISRGRALLHDALADATAPGAGERNQDPPPVRRSGDD